MPHLEEQFPPVNPLVLQRPDALQPPDREEEEASRTENRAEDETPIPGSLADGIDRVTLSANARVIVPVQPLEETVPSENVANPGLLDIEIQNRNSGTESPTTDEITGASLQDFANGVEESRTPTETTTRIDQSPEEPLIAPVFTLAIPPTQNAERATRAEPVSRIENRITAVASPVANVEPERNEVAAPVSEFRFIPVASPPSGPLSIEPDDAALAEPAAGTPLENPLGLRGNTPVPLDRRVNILTPVNVGEDPPGPNIEEARNFGQGRTLSLDLATVGNEDTLIAVDTIDEALEQDGTVPEPETNEEAPFELLLAPAVRTGFVAEPNPVEVIESTPRLSISEPPGPALADPTDIPGPAGAEVAVSSLIDTRQVFEEDQETQALQAPAFPELDPNEQFISNAEPEAREEDIPAVVQAPLNVPPPAVENAVPVAPPAPGNVEALDENPQALRRDNLGTDPALRSNRELRNFLQEFNDRIEPPEAVTEPAGGPVTEVQNNAPPPPAVFENLETLSAELLASVRERQATEGVTRPEEERAAPPEPRTPESLLTGRGQNIDRFI